VQANKCWEARVSEEELGSVEDKVARKPDAADFKQLKILLRMLEDRIAQAVPNVRGGCPELMPAENSRPRHTDWRLHASRGVLV
jgi:hypothetical protein